MSLMAMSASRSSVFTFESTAHSSHVLHCLDEQRSQDILCDVTVVVEDQSFRAHRSVLASCSEYFSHRISAFTQHGAVITLPPEVTAAGFEPLLKFAYTSKLHFGKDNVLEIRNSASVLGFRDLDEACFEFLLPKFFSNSEGSDHFPRKTCCKKKCKRRLSKEDRGIDSDDVLLDEKEVKPVVDSSTKQEVAWLCKKSVNSKMGSHNSIRAPTPVADGTTNSFMQCPKYRKFQMACGKESCVTEKRGHSPATVISADCGLSCMPCSSSANCKNKTETGLPGNSASNSTRQSKEGADDPWKSEMHDTKMRCKEAPVVMMDEREGKWKEKETETDVRTEDKREQAVGFSSSGRSTVTADSVGERIEPCARSSGLILRHCPLRAIDEAPVITRSSVIGSSIRDSGALQQKTEAQEEAGGKGDNNAWQERGNGGQTCGTERVALVRNNAREKSTMEKAENLARPLWPDVASSQAKFQDLDLGCASDTGSEHVQGTSLECLEQVNLDSSSNSCPFFQDLEQGRCSWKGAGLSECEGASQSGLSSLNSGDDGDSETETEGDSESCARERARQVQLPFSVDCIVDLSRNDFQQLLKDQVFTPEQLEFVHDMRRRSKNRLAAQRCRKRKLDCIYTLQCEINKLKTEREKLMMEKSQLSQLKLNTCHSLSTLCQRVCNEAKMQPEQLQVLARYTSPDCPLASIFPHIDALLSLTGLTVEPDNLLSACPAGLDRYLAIQEASSTSSKDTVTGDDQPLF